MTENEWLTMDAQFHLLHINTVFPIQQRLVDLSPGRLLRGVQPFDLTPGVPNHLSRLQAKYRVERVITQQKSTLQIEHHHCLRNTIQQSTTKRQTPLFGSIPHSPKIGKSLPSQEQAKKAPTGQCEPVQPLLIPRPYARLRRHTVLPTRH
ncbi:hypothetical protein D3C75_666480 [compost metagenome]